MVCRGLGLGLGFSVRKTSDQLLVQQVLNRAYVAGRDGSLVQSGGTGGSSLCPWTGSTIASGGTCGFDLPIPGVGSLRFSHAQGARTNLTSVQGVTGGSHSLSGISRVIVENTGASYHETYSPALTLTDAATYTVSSAIVRVVGSRHAVIYLDQGGVQRAGVAINLTTGATTNLTVGGGTLSNVTAVALSGGGWKLNFNAVNAAWGGSVRLYQHLSSNGTGLSSYTGDGASSVSFTTNLELASFPGIGLAEGITRTADNILWTPPAALSTTSGEVVALAVPYGWSAGAGAANPTGATMRWIYNSAVMSIYRFSSGSDTGGVSDAGGFQFGSASALADAPGIIRQMSVKYSTDIKFYRGSTLTATDSTGISAPWATVSNLRIACEPGNEAFSAVAALYIPGGLTDAERAALARYFNGRVVPIYA